MFALGLSLATLIGVSLGMLGGGGSIVTVPVLVYALGIDAKTAIAMSLPVVGITSLVGAAMHRRHGNVRVRIAVAFGAIAMIGAFAGAKAAVFMSGATQLSLLAAVMLVAAVSMLRGGVGGNRTFDTAVASKPKVVVLLPVALGVGVLTGVVGIGGGFLVVPALVLIARIPMRQAVGTSLLVIAMNSASGFLGYLGTVQIDWLLLTGFTTAAVAGALIGTAIASKMPQAALKRAFAALLVAMGAFVLIKNRSEFAALKGCDSCSSNVSTTSR